MKEEYSVSYDSFTDRFHIYKTDEPNPLKRGISDEDLTEENKPFFQKLINQYAEENKDIIYQKKEYNKVSSLFENNRKKATVEGVKIILPDDFNPDFDDWEKFIKHKTNTDSVFIYDDIRFLSGTAGFMIKDKQGKVKKQLVIWRS